MDPILGIDIGGSGIKGALVDLEKGEFASDRLRIATPASRLPDDVMPVLKEIVDHFDYKGPLGIGFPAITVNGVPRSPFTAIGITEWVGYPVGEKAADITGCDVTMINDADAAGLAEIRFGPSDDHIDGTIVFLTLGTGVGSAIFNNGHLLPNTELGKLYLQGKDYYAELDAASRIKDELDLSWEQYAARLDAYLNYVELIFTPDLFMLGGGISKKSENFVPLLTVMAKVAPATLRNKAGIIGAAMAAVNMGL